MKFTIFTPTHNATFLKRLRRSIENQTYQNFEWLIVPNGDVTLDKSDYDIPQAVIRPYKGVTNNIGEIKSFCCNNSTGDFLVEVDHDDEITPNCLEELANAFSDTSVDFVYSNFAELRNDEPFFYSDVYGWEKRLFSWNDKTVFEMISFPSMPATFSKIWFAPNHVRAWKKSFYMSIGGHNHSYAVLDDHDLLCRTYINGKVQHIDKCLYVYHVHQNNSYSGSKNEFIQQETLNIHDKYIYQMAEKWCDLNNLRKIDLCGGHSKPSGYESIDLKGADINANLNKKWPFKNEEIGIFRAHDALEHLKNPIHSMKEAYRCLAPNGWFLTFTPSTDGRGAFQDPTHISFWNSNSFWYYTRTNQAKYIDTPVKFQLNRIKNYFPSKWHEEHNILYVKADLLKFSGRTSGLIEI